MTCRRSPTTSAGASLAAAPEHGYRGDTTPMIEIGSRVWAAQGLSVVAHRHIEIGDDVRIDLEPRPERETRSAV